jgi:iron complex outermembrane receptor protein
MFRKTKVCTGLMLAFGGSLALGTAPVQAQQQLERVEITGSAIKRVQSEGPAPVEIYTRKDIERTGATTVTELVKNISSLDIDDQGELTGNSPSGSGTTNLQIRGLSERNLLVLLNGRRLPVNALHDGSGAGAAVDVNSIPVSAIERIEVLKDGGSAIYGADAVAGVINFITRKNYTGLEARVGYGVSSEGDAKETPAGLVFGVGDYDSQGFNVLAALDFFKRDGLPRTARDITRSADWTRFAGGTGNDGRSVFHPSGNIVDPATFAPLGTVVPCPPEDQDPSGFCIFDFSKTILESINPADRVSALVIGSVKLGDNMRAFGELTYSRSQDTFLAQPAPGFFVDGLGQLVAGRFMQVGPRTTDRKGTLTQATAGLEGTVGSIDWDVAIGQGVSKVSNNDSNYLNATLFQDALADGTIDPTITTNPTSVLDALRLTPTREGESKLTFLNGKFSGQLAQLGGGPLQYAVGVNLNKESLSDNPDENQRAGNVFGSIQQSPVEASRDLRALFAELSIPVIAGLEIQAALRRDNYSGLSATIAGVNQTGTSTGKTSPKLAVKYQPVSSVALRASYAESFLAPSLKQLFGGQEQGAESLDCLNDPANPVCVAFGNTTSTNFPYNEISGSNPDLKPETGKTFNVGIIVEPVPQLSLALDWFRIKKEDEITTLSVESAAENGDVGRSATGEALVFVNLQNVAAAKIEGVDLDVRLRLGDTPLGRMTLQNATTYYTKNQRQFEPGEQFFEYNGTFLFPRWRNTLRVNFERGPWATNLALRSTASMKDSDQPAGEAENITARTIDAYEEVDVGVQYTGIKNLTLGAQIKNVFDRQPPYSNEGTQNQYGSLGFPWIYSPRGRFFQFVANYKFW